MRHELIYRMATEALIQSGLVTYLPQGVAANEVKETLKYC